MINSLPAISIESAKHEHGMASILIVEDSDTQAKIIESLIHKWKIQCIVSRVASLRDAVAVLQDFSPTVILLDLCLPDSDGVKTVESIVPLARGVAIIVLTAKANEEIGEQAMAAGAQDFLAKDELNEKFLNRAFRHAVQRQRIVNANAQLADQLFQERSLLSDLINHVPYYIVWKNREGRYLGCNEAFAKFAGIGGTKDVVGLCDTDLPLFAAGGSTFAIHDNAIMETGRAVMQQEQSLCRAEGQSVTLLTSRVPLRDAHQAVTGMLGIYVDISERKNLESKLAHSQKLESIGQLAAGIAHEINTPTQYVSDNVRFLKDQFSGILSLVDSHAELLNEQPANWVQFTEQLRSQLRALDFDFGRKEIPAAIDQSLEGLNRISTIVRAMKDFSHPGSENKESADLNKAIDSTITVCRARWKYVAEVERSFDPNLRDVPCLVAEFNQVILNILVNAADAIAERFANGANGKGLIRVSTLRTDGFAEITIEDNGCGIPEKIRGRIYDPFFTTKEVGKGSGQGLTISRDVIVNKHGGTIDCQSSVGTGTVFTIRLPLFSQSGKEAA